MMRLLAKNFNEEAVRRIGVDAVTLLDEFAENLLEELDYTQVIYIYIYIYVYMYMFGCWYPS